MSNVRNTVQLIGHLGADPEIKTFDNGGKVARLRIATNESYKNQKGEWVDNTQWHTVSAHGFLTERVEKQLKKGSFVIVEGSLRHNEYTDAQGVKKWFTEIRANSIYSLDKRTGENVDFENQSDSQSKATPAPMNNIVDDDLPF